MSELPPLPPGGPEAPRLAAQEIQAKADRKRAEDEAQAQDNRLREIDRARVKASNNRSANKRAKMKRAEVARNQAAARRAKRARDRKKRRAMKPSRARARRARIKVALLVLATLLAVIGLVVAGSLVGGPNVSTSLVGQVPLEPGEVRSVAEGSTQAVDTSSELLGTQLIPVDFEHPVLIRLGGTESSLWSIAVSEPVRANRAPQPDYRVDIVLRLESSDSSEPLALPGFDEPWLFRSGQSAWQPTSWADSECASNGLFTELVRTETLVVGDEYSGSLCTWQLSPFVDFRDVDVVLRTSVGEVVFSSGGNLDDSHTIDRSIDSLDHVGFRYGRRVAVDAGNEAFPSIWNFYVGKPVALAPPGPQDQEDVIMSFQLDAELVESFQVTDGIFGDVFAIVGGASGNVYPVALSHYPCGGQFHPPDNARARIGYTATTFGCATVSSRDASSEATFVSYTDRQAAEVVTFRGGGIAGVPALLEEPKTPAGLAFDSTVTFENSLRDEAGDWTVRSWAIEPSESPEWSEVTIVVGFRPEQDETVSVVVEPSAYILGGATRQVHRAPCDAAADPQRPVIVGDEMHELAWCLRVPATDSGHADTRVGLTVFQDDYVFDGAG